MLFSFPVFQAGDALLTNAEFFAQAIQKCVPKSHAQAMGEVQVTAAFLNNVRERLNSANYSKHGWQCFLIFYAYSLSSLQVTMFGAWPR